MAKKTKFAAIGKTRPIVRKSTARGAKIATDRKNVEIAPTGTAAASGNRGRAQAGDTT